MCVSFVFVSVRLLIALKCLPAGSVQFLGAGLAGGIASTLRYASPVFCPSRQDVEETPSGRAYL